jgi:hypothetical protein
MRLLSWKIQDGTATRQDSLNIADKLAKASAENSAEILEATEEMKSNPPTKIQ